LRGEGESRRKVRIAKMPFCTKCGNEHSITHLYCSKCGEMVSDENKINDIPVEQNQQIEQDAMSENDLTENSSKIYRCSICGVQINENKAMCLRCECEKENIFAEVNGRFVKREGELKRKDEQNVAPLSDFLVWCLVFYPIILTIIEIIANAYEWGFINSHFWLYIIPFGLKITCWDNDRNELKRTGYNAGWWTAWGIFIVPVYLFIRAGKTNQKYLPAIISSIIWVIGFFAVIVDLLATLEHL
jgi:hypothetical protein